MLHNINLFIMQFFLASSLLFKTLSYKEVKILNTLKTKKPEQNSGFLILSKGYQSKLSLFLFRGQLL